jgi:hypothetical protein
MNRESAEATVVDPAAMKVVATFNWRLDRIYRLRWRRQIFANDRSSAISP